VSGANRRSLAAGTSALLLLTLAACTGGAPGDTPSPGAAPAGTVTEAAARTAINQPRPAGAGSLGAELPAGMGPTKAPGQAGGDLAGQALPTNQWWTSALTGPGTETIWTHPLAVKAGDAGLQVSSAPPKASANSVVTPFIPALTAGSGVSGVHVTGYGAFHVVLRADLKGGGSVDATLVQGSPLLYLRFHAAPAALTVTGELKVLGGGDTTSIVVAGQRWDVLAIGGGWRQEGDTLTAGGDQVAIARVPDGVDATAWDAAIAGSAGDPVVKTTAAMAYDGAAGTVTQTLTAEHASGKPGVWALLPHQSANLVRQEKPFAGTFPDALGLLSLVRAKEVQIRVPMPGLLTGAPAVALPDAAKSAIVADLDRDLADPPGAGGSYFGLKELGRLATIAEVAQSVGATAQRDAALGKLRPQLVDWLTYSGPSDSRYFAYDKTWGGLIAVPAEFGSNDYNDHHFQYGYLVRAAAVLGQSDPGFLRDYGNLVDLVVHDYAGGSAGLPAFRAFNAYAGHSGASGFAPFADGNNQESSSEAVAAWEAVARWGVVRHDDALTRFGVTHYALEAATARMYWLGEGIKRLDGYAHTSAGMVWDAKIDYATFFDPKPESVQGIQLLPLTFGSLYRADPKAAAARTAELEKAVGGAPRVWGDLFVADLALTDPAAARKRLTPDLPREESTSRGLVRYWVELLAAVGPPQPGVVADGPYGLAFGSRDHPTLVAVNPTNSARTVEFRSKGDVTAKVAVDAGRSVSKK